MIDVHIHTSKGLYEVEAHGSVLQLSLDVGYLISDLYCQLLKKPGSRSRVSELCADADQ